MKQEYSNFLDELRETGAVNMFGAAPYLVDAFPELSVQKARAIVDNWMKSFGKQA